MMSESDRFPDNVPDHVLDELAHALYPALLAFYEDEANQRAYAAWQAQRQSKAT